MEMMENFLLAKLNKQKNIEKRNRTKTNYKKRKYLKKKNH